MDKSEKRAREIIAHHIDKIRCLPPDSILSLILVGSLSNDSYTGNLGSDIDLIHILKDGAPPGAKKRILTLIEMTEAETRNDIPISKCVYTFSQLSLPYNELSDTDKSAKELAELPVEILRIKESGITLFGANVIDSIRTPGREDVLESFRISRRNTAQLARTDPVFYERYQRTLADPPVRLIAQIVLTGAMEDLYITAGVSCSNKREISDRIKKYIPRYGFTGLLDLCVRWRYDAGHFTEEDAGKMKALYQEWRAVRGNE